MEAKATTTNIYEFTDYRAFLKAYYETRKRENRRYSFTTFAKQADIGSRNHLWQAMTGRRNLTLVTIRKFAKGLKLKKHEAEYFENLVLFNQAKTNEEKNIYYKKLASSKHYIEVRHIEHDQYEFLSRWYYAAIRELVNLPSFVEDPAWIAKRLAPQISEKEAGEALELLFRLGLLGRDTAGRAIQTERHLSTANEVAHLAAANFHKQMIAKAAQAVDRSNAEHREISSLTVGVAKEHIAEIKQRIQAFRREIHAFIESKGKTDAIYQFNLQFFNLSEVPDEAN